jgi:hypothetical protein
MSLQEPSGGPANLVPHLDEDALRRLQIVKGEVNRHKRIRIFGLLGILALLVIVYPLLVFLDGLSIPGWRTAQMAGRESAVLPTSLIQRITIDISAKRLTLMSGTGNEVTLPIVPPERAAAGRAQIETWKPGTLSLGTAYPCIERGTAGILRALGRPSLYDPHAGRCLRIDAAAYDAIFTHATSDTRIEFR